MSSKLQEKRLKEGYTQQYLSNATRIPLQTIQKLEIKANKIDSLKVKAILALCRELNCYPEDILEDEENCYHFTAMRCGF